MSSMSIAVAAQTTTSVQRCIRICVWAPRGEERGVDGSFASAWSSRSGATRRPAVREPQFRLVRLSALEQPALARVRDGVLERRARVVARLPAELGAGA